MLGIGSTELLIIAVFGFLLFGPDKLPQMGRTLGRALRQFRETQQKMTAVVQTEVIDPMTAVANEPLKPKKRAVSEDDDADVPEEETPAHKETFAERRARLAAEKAAREEGAAAGDSEEGVEAPSADAPAAEERADETSSSAAPGAAGIASEAPAEPARTTADLYARRPRKHKAAEAVQEDASMETPAEGSVEHAVIEDVPAADADASEGGEQ